MIKLNTFPALSCSKNYRCAKPGAEAVAQKNRPKRVNSIMLKAWKNRRAKPGAEAVANFY